MCHVWLDHLRQRSHASIRPRGLQKLSGGGASPLLAWASRGWPSTPSCHSCGLHLRISPGLPKAGRPAADASRPDARGRVCLPGLQGCFGLQMRPIAHRSSPSGQPPHTLPAACRLVSSSLQEDHRIPDRAHPARSKHPVNARRQAGDGAQAGRLAGGLSSRLLHR